MAHPPGPVAVGPELARIHEHWSPRIVAEANGWHIKLVKAMGDFVTHIHDVDEVFWVLRGRLVVHVDDAAYALRGGDLLVVPAGTPHRPSAIGECHLVLLEPAGVPNTGDLRCDRTVEDRWA